MFKYKTITILLLFYCIFDQIKVFGEHKIQLYKKKKTSQNLTDDKLFEH